jgi:hypothetical protein
VVKPGQTIQTARHDQCSITRLPEQQAEFRVTGANGSQQILFGLQAGFDGQRNR